MSMNDAELNQWAHARAHQLRTFYVHLAVYVTVMLFLFLLNAVTRDAPSNYMFGGHMYHQPGGDWWVIWPALGWGLAVAIHGVFVFVGGPGKVDTWEDRKAEQLVRREKEKTGA
jgi:hypothetical protein